MKPKTSSMLHLTVAAFVLLSVSGCGPKKKVDKSETSAHNKTATPRPADTRPAEPGKPTGPKVASFDHSIFNKLLAKYVDPNGRVNYAAWLTSADDLKALDTYLKSLAGAKTANLAQPAALAFWINAYNAATLRGVLNKLPGKKDFSVSDNGFVFFDEAVYPVSRMTVSLNEIENGLLRAGWGHKSLKKTPPTRLARLKSLHKTVLKAGQRHIDPRIHFALVCASVGCPNLRTEAYAGSRLEAQLDDQTRKYINDSTKGANDKGVSSLFHWFAGDFKATHGTVEAFIKKHYKGEMSKLKLKAQINYSWKLNAQ